MAKRPIIFDPIPTRRIFEEIVGQIRQRIYDGELKPGDRLPGERDLAIQFGVGRTVVREALRTLEEGGLVEIKKGSDGGAFVKKADSSVATRSLTTLIHLGHITVDDLTEARIWLEQVVIEHAALHRTEEDLRRLEENIQQSEEIVRQGVVPRKVNLDFHVMLAEAAKNPIFVMLIESLMGVLRGFLEERELAPSLEYLATVSASHRRIYEAVRDGDPERARQALLGHLLDINAHFSSLGE